MNNPYLNTTISHGTPRTVDLLEAFIEALEVLSLRNQDAGIDVITMLRSADYWVRQMKTIDDAPADIAEELEIAASEFLNWNLFNMMNEFAPEGYYFGSLEGDGSDFGFWQAEEN